MVKLRDPYDPIVSPYSPYPGSTEPDLRKEFNNTMDGVFPEVAKSIPLILRKMQRKNGELILCPCVDRNTKEPDVDIFCKFCHGEGKFWNEVWIDGYSLSVSAANLTGALREKLTEPGTINEPLTLFYIRSRIPLTMDDRIIEVCLDEQGKPSRPYRRSRLYRIGNLVDLRADNGKLEYRKVETFSEQRKFLNGINK